MVAVLAETIVTGGPETGAGEPGRGGGDRILPQPKAFSGAGPSVNYPLEALAPKKALVPRRRVFN